MLLNLFSVPIFIGNIDSSKIKLSYKEIKSSFLSDIQTSCHNQNNIEDESLTYLLTTIGDLLKEKVTCDFSLKLTHIWENHYINNDYQEAHIHASSDISFIIYKKVEQSNTIFFHPNKNLVRSFYGGDWFKGNFFGLEQYKIECRENQIVVFPSFVEHMVLKTSKATTIAGNIIINKE